MRVINNKKGISEMVSYVLLVVIALGLSVSVYYFLVLYIPKPPLECKPDISVSIEQINCYPGSVFNVTLKNRGLFTIDTLQIIVREPGREIKAQIDAYLPLGSKGLIPGESYTEIMNPSSLTVQTYSMEVKPWARNDKGEKVLCTNAIIVQDFVCPNIQVS